MKIGIDIDDTIANTYDVMFSYAQYYTLMELEKKQENVDRDSIDHMYTRNFHQWKEEEENTFFKKYYEKIIQETKPKMYAKECIAKWKEEGNQIYIITARFKAEYINVEEATKKWLEENEIPYDVLITNANHKAEIVQKEAIEVFIDDSIRNCEEIAEIGVKTYMMDSIVNKNYESKNVEKVYSWPHLEQKLARK